MSELSENTITAALTFKVPQQVGWSVQQGDQSWTGKELHGLMARLANEEGRSVTLSVSLAFELPGDGGTVRT